MKRNFLFAIGLSLSLSACQDVEPPAQVLTQEQWNDVKANILSEEPSPQYKVGAQFDERIELIGLDVSGPLEAGKEVTFTWYWRALKDGTDNWKAFIHLDAAKEPFRQNLDHVPVRDLFQTGKWKKGQIIKDEQKVTIRNDFPDGDAIPYIGFFKGEARLKVSNDVAKTQEAQPRVIGPTLKIKGKAEAKPQLPEAELLKTNAEIQVDGKLDEPVWSTIPGIRLKPFGSAPTLNTIVKGFVSDTHLHIGARMSDKNIWGKLTERDSDTWTEEVLELFLDVDGDGKDYLELQITPNNVIFDAHFKEQLGKGQGTRQEQIDRARAVNLEGLKSAVHVEGTLNDDKEDQAWTAEISIPLQEIPGFKSANIGDSWAVNFYRFDRPEAGKTHAYGWSTEPRGDFHQVDKFGKLNIVSEVKMAPNLAIERPNVANLPKPTGTMVSPELIEEMKKQGKIKPEAAEPK